MPLDMDVHKGLDGVPPEDAAEVHQRDISIQDQFGIRFLSYWFNERDAKAFCLVESPDKDSLVACHKKSHGLMPHEVIEVSAPMLSSFLGDTSKDANERAMVDGTYDTGLRAIMFTDIEGSTDVSTAHGDETAVRLVRRHDAIVRNALSTEGGREIKHTGDGILASFTSVPSCGGIDIDTACDRRRAERGSSSGHQERFERRRTGRGQQRSVWSGGEPGSTYL